MAKFSFGILLIFSCAVDASNYDGQNQGLTGVPINIPENTTYVLLDHNMISTIDTFPALPEVVGLQLIWNDLKYFPNLANISESLLYLYLAQNRIEYIEPARLDLLVSLKRLWIQRNRLTVFPDVSGPGQTLEELALNSNLFSEFPSMMKLGNNLKRLYFSTNPLESSIFPELKGSAEFFRHLEHLDVRKLHLELIPKSSLEKFENLKVLHLSDNKLKDFPYLSALKESLEEIHLNNNPIEHIDTDVLTQMPQLRTLNLRGCQVSRPPNLCRLPAGLTLDLRDNPLRCDCHARWLMMAGAAGVTLLLDQAPCVYPPHLVGVDWASVSDKDLVCDDMKTDFSVRRVSATTPFLCSSWTEPLGRLPAASMDNLGCADACAHDPDCAMFGLARDLDGTVHCEGYGTNVTGGGGAMPAWDVYTIE